METVVMHIDWPDRYEFFKRMLPALDSLNLKTIFLTNKLALHRRAIRQGIESELITGRSRCHNVDLANTREVLSQALSDSEAQRLYSAARGAIERIVARGNSLRAVFIWNGSGVAGKSLRDFCQCSGIDQLYFEISNLPGKLFVDGGGVNARSWLAEDIAILDHLQADEGEFQHWLDKYLQKKLAISTLPQAKILDQVSYRDTLMNWLGFRLGRIPTDDHTSLLAKLFNKKKRKLPMDLDEPPANDIPFIFFPMQVSNDSQILLNSDVDNSEAIRFAADLARREKCQLLVKPHPAESNMQEIQQILTLRKELGFYLVADNTLDLIRRSHSVVSINSTVGLEAILLGKHVIFLGRTFYNHFYDRKRLAQYVLAYLLDIDYFSSETMYANEVGQLISRLAFNREYSALR